MSENSTAERRVASQLSRLQQLSGTTSCRTPPVLIGLQGLTIAEKFGKVLYTPIYRPRFDSIIGGGSLEAWAAAHASVNAETKK